MECVFCESNDLYEICIKEKKYYRCKNCGGVFLDKEFRLSLLEQKKRYQHHNNDCSDKGYYAFLENFATPVLDAVGENIVATSLNRILDYGCGPLSNKLDGFSNLLYVVQKRLSDSVLYSVWDPFFSPSKTCLETPFDLVFCLEVAEHFERVEADFESLARCCAKGGSVAIGTMIVPKSDEDFKKWWYKDDETHVSFYSEKALFYCAKRCGLDYKKALSERIFLLEKF